jgi:hypothetical protein
MLGHFYLHLEDSPADLDATIGKADNDPDQYTIEIRGVTRGVGRTATIFLTEAQLVALRDQIAEALNSRSGTPPPSYVDYLQIIMNETRFAFTALDTLQRGGLDVAQRNLAVELEQHLKNAQNYATALLRST